MSQSSRICKNQFRKLIFTPSVLEPRLLLTTLPEFMVCAHIDMNLHLYANCLGLFLSCFSLWENPITMNWVHQQEKPLTRYVIGAIIGHASELVVIASLVFLSSAEARWKASRRQAWLLQVTAAAKMVVGRHLDPSGAPQKRNLAGRPGRHGGPASIAYFIPYLIYYI